MRASQKIDLLRLLLAIGKMASGSPDKEIAKQARRLRLTRLRGQPAIIIGSAMKLIFGALLF